MVVFKITNAKMRRYVLAVPYEQIVSVMLAFARHVHFAKASLKFRREFGSGVPDRLTLADRMAYALASPQVQMAIASMTVIANNKAVTDQFMNYPLYQVGPHLGVSLV